MLAKPAGGVLHPRWSVNPNWKDVSFPISTTWVGWDSILLSSSRCTLTTASVVLASTDPLLGNQAQYISWETMREVAKSSPIALTIILNLLITGGRVTLATTPVTRALPGGTPPLIVLL